MLRFFLISVIQEVPFNIFLLKIIGPKIFFDFVLKKLQVYSIFSSSALDPMHSCKMGFFTNL